MALEQAESPEKKAFLAHTFASSTEVAAEGVHGGLTEMGDIFSAGAGAGMEKFLQEKLETLVQVM